MAVCAYLIPRSAGLLLTVISNLQFTIGETVRVRGEDLVYKVLAMTGNMITILIVNPQPDGTQQYFSSSSLRTVDGSNLERI